MLNHEGVHLMALLLKQRSLLGAGDLATITLTIIAEQEGTT
jgi:hypothetical protein